MSSFNFKITGATELSARLEKATGNLRRIVNQELSDGAEAIAAEAKLRAASGVASETAGNKANAGDYGTLIGGINAGKVGDLQYRVTSKAKYSAYVEFGTGLNVEVTPDIPGLKEYAYTFFISGKGRTHPHPFFFPAARRLQPIIISKIQQALDKVI
jgi:HK97 gp10 family phage protein